MDLSTVYGITNDVTFTPVVAGIIAIAISVCWVKACLYACIKLSRIP